MATFPATSHIYGHFTGVVSTGEVQRNLSYESQMNDAIIYGRTMLEFMMRLYRIINFGLLYVRANVSTHWATSHGKLC